MIEKYCYNCMYSIKREGNLFKCPLVKHVINISSPACKRYKEMESIYECEKVVVEEGVERWKQYMK